MSAARKRPLLGLFFAAIGTAIAVAILCSLGMWQVHRLAWKEALLADVASRPHQPPVAAPGPSAWPGFAIDAWRYRAVKLTGHFLPQELDEFMPLTEPKGPIGGIGYFVIQPFVTQAGWTVLVNRGFVPDAKKDPATRPQSLTGPGTVTFTGLVRESETPNMFTPKPELKRNIWFARNREQMGDALKLPDATLAPYFVDVDARSTPPGGLPQGGETRMSFPNNHLQYALTWFGLAAGFLSVFVLFAWRRLTGREERAPLVESVPVAVAQPGGLPHA